MKRTHKYYRKFMKKYYLSPDSKKQSFVLFTGNGNRELGQEVAKDLKATLGKVSMIKLENGESFIKINENVNLPTKVNITVTSILFKL